jgi:putative transposase
LQALIAAVPYRIHTVLTDNVLTQEGKAGEKKRSLSIPYGMDSTVTPSGFHEQGLSVRP